MRVTRAFPLLLVIIVTTLFSGLAFSGQEKEDVVVYEGYFSRQGNNGKMAEMSGFSHYVKFYPNNRVIRLYISYPYSKQVSPEVISKVFKKVSGQTTGNAYIRDTFGLLDKPIVAHLDVFRRIDGEIKFDCGASAPCTIEFLDGLIQVVKKGIVKDHIIKYEHVNE